MARGIIIVAVTLAIGAAVVVTQFDNFFSQNAPVTRIQPETPPPEEPPTAGITKISILAGSSAQGAPDYDPDDAQVPVGNKVVWENRDNVFHTATSGTGQEDPEMGAAFDTGLINGGESSDEITIGGDVGDTFAYFCQVHPYMTSQLTIVEAEEGGASGGTEGPTLTILAGASTQGAPDYDSDPMTVSAGDAITVHNADNVFHTVTSGAQSDPDAGQLFDTGLMDAGATATIDTAELEPGAYDYFCLVHPYMVGKLQIE